MVQDQGLAAVGRMQLVKLFGSVLVCVVLGWNRERVSTESTLPVLEQIGLESQSRDQALVEEQIVLLKQLAMRLGVGVALAPMAVGGVTGSVPNESGGTIKLIGSLKENTYRLIDALQAVPMGDDSSPVGEVGPLRGFPVRSGKITSPFGYRLNPFSNRYENHKGVDVAAREGDEILATGDGVVTYAGVRGAYGILIEIDHGGGVISRYGHCRYAYVKSGERVFSGKTIGLVGSSGRSTGPHLHYEVVVNGVERNPLYSMYP